MGICLRLIRWKPLIDIILPFVVMLTFLLLWIVVPILDIGLGLPMPTFSLYLSELLPLTTTLFPILLIAELGFYLWFRTGTNIYLSI